MRRLSLSEFVYPAVLLFGGATICRTRRPQPRRTTKCCNVHRSFGTFPTKTVCYARNVSKIGKYIKFDETCHQSRSYQNVMINFHRTACRRRRHCGQRRIAIDSRTCSFEIFDNEQVTVEANRHRLPNLLSNCGHSVKKWHIRRDWLTMTIRLLHLLSLWHWPNRFITGTGRARAEVEEETDLFLKTVAKT